MPTIFIAIIIIIGLVFIWGFILGYRLFRKAQLLEKNKKYEEAAMHYAQCILNTVMFGAVQPAIIIIEGIVNGKITQEI